MNPTRDEDALNWAGDDDPTLQNGSTDPARTEPSALPAGWTIPQGAAHPTAVPSTTDAASPEPDGADVTAQPDSAAASSAALVGMGILAGMYLLYTVGWFIGVARIEKPISDPVAEFMFSLGAWLAVAAPLAWFGATYWLTTGSPRARRAWLLIGVLVLAPLPFILGTGTLA
ncbi:DNA polymerase III subunit gamma/tau [Cryobacterium sp. TMT1-3]|uniref:DNA polymerase III subunit gamma/tau n=1 Tax=Cryobacterium luteum TaxID=1424661 RepID=A0A1H8ED39_9MICO|nr:MULTISPECIES: hypothetical protein [Cryobacterium]TFB89886.1 DNA polymerase III subunit gamma/tau [Cryobacterium luteum]TFC25598.1 DNA polymerase III subunit gamma/tau [Cryobacterium sp. TMT1-3]SEN17491.1 hypothetical protein SAMN05216281_104231 [Cryobacterium luteum]